MTTTIHWSAADCKRLYDALIADGFKPVSFNVDRFNPGQVPRTIIDLERARDGAGLDIVTLVLT